VLGDRYVLTAAHCLTDGRGNAVKSAKRIEVRYWSSEQSKRDARKVSGLTLHENLLHQERLSYPSARPGDYINFPVNHEDIAVLKLTTPHPAGAIGAFVPAVDNDYTAADETGNSTWFYARRSTARMANCRRRSSDDTDPWSGSPPTSRLSFFTPCGK